MLEPSSGSDLTTDLPIPRSRQPRGSTPNQARVRRALERAYLRFYWAYREAAKGLREGIATADIEFLLNQKGASSLLLEPRHL